MSPIFLLDNLFRFSFKSERVDPKLRSSNTNEPITLFKATVFPLDYQVTITRKLYFY